MAGGHDHVRLDPAMERWGAMRENVFQHFKFTRTATRQVAMWGVLMPLTIFTIAWASDNRYDWAGKLRGQSLLTNPPKEDKADE